MGAVNLMLFLIAYLLINEAVLSHSFFVIINELNLAGKHILVVI